MLQDSSLSKRVMSIGVASCSSKGMVDILHGHRPFSPSHVILLKHCYTRAFFLLRNVVLKALCAYVEQSFPHVLCLAWKASLCLEEKTTKPKSDAGFVSVFRPTEVSWNENDFHFVLINSTILWYAVILILHPELGIWDSWKHCPVTEIEA